MECQILPFVTESKSFIDLRNFRPFTVVEHGELNFMRYITKCMYDAFLRL
jgi:hypothetical protein